MIQRLFETGLKWPIPNYCQPLTMQNVQKDEEAILKTISAIRFGKLPNDLLLLNYYNEMPISFGASVEYIDRGIVVMMVHSFQAAAMMMQGMTFIKSDRLPYWVTADVLKVDRENNLAFLAIFSYVHNPAERRMHVRIPLPDMIEASFHNRKMQVPGEVHEISYGGIALLSPRTESLKEKEKGVVSLNLATATLEVPGIFIKCQEQEFLSRHIFLLEMNARCERILSQYIYEQQSKVLNEAKGTPVEEKGEIRF